MEAVTAESNDQQDFNAGFDLLEPTAMPPVKEDTPEPVKYAQITEEDLKRFQENDKRIEEMRETFGKRFDTAFGKMGGIERTLTQLASATPSGQNVELTEDIVADMAEDFPEFAELQLKTLKKFAQTIKGTGPAPQPIDVDGQVNSRLIALQIEALEDEYPDWRTIVGDAESNNEYRQWLSKQDESYQQKLNSTNSAAIIARSIQKFSSDAPKPKPSARQNLIRDAVTPRGDGGPPAATNADDEFNAGFTGR